MGSPSQVFPVPCPVSIFPQTSANILCWWMACLCCWAGLETEVGLDLAQPRTGMILQISTILLKILVPFPMSDTDWLRTLHVETDGLTKSLCYPDFRMFLEDLSLDMTTVIAMVLPLPDFSDWEPLVPRRLQFFLSSEHAGTLLLLALTTCAAQSR